MSVRMFSIRRVCHWILAGLLLVFASLSQLVEAQAPDRGVIVGTATDSGGGAIAGAEISVINIDTGITTSTKSDSAGDYSLRSLLVGNYRISVVHPGFKRAVIENVRVQVGAIFRADVVLQVGDVISQVTVQALSPLLQSETSDVSTVIEHKRIVDLPLNGRDFQQLQLLTPGAVNTMSFQTSDVSGLGGGAAGVATNTTMIISNGSRPGSQTFLVDGAYDSNRQGRSIVYTPSIDEIEEFRVSGANFSAEVGYGSNAISVATRSGTNRFHGAAWDFFRNNDLDSRNFFALSPPRLSHNEFGGMLGGPVIHNKTFFFISYEGLQERTQRYWLTTVPTEKMRGGDLSELGVPIYDPLSSHYNNQGVIVRSVFPGATIPASRIDPVSAFFLQWYPQPNRSGIGNNFYNDPPFGDSFNQYNIRIDHRFSDRDTLMGRFSQRLAEVPQQGPYQGHSYQNYNPGVIGLNTHSTNAVVSWNHIFSPSTSLEIRPSYTRPYINQFSGANIGTDYTSQEGIQGFGPGISDVYPTWPEMDISGFSPIYSYIGFVDLHNSRDIVASVTTVRGRHMLHIGNEYASYQEGLYPSGQGQGQFSYTGIYSSNPSVNGATGAGFADYLFGYPSSGGRYVPPGVYYIELRNNWSWIQDDWKVSSRFTLNLGVRYELNFPTTEKYDQLATWIPSARDGRGAIVIPNEASITGDKGNLHPSVQRSLATYLPLSVFANDVGLPEHSMRFLNKHAFAPRIGFAWRLNHDFVIRSAYGIFYNQLDGNRETEFLSPPFLIRESGVNNSYTANGAPAKTTQTLFPAGSSFSPQPYIFAHDPWVKDFGYTQQWNFFVQKLLPGSVGLDVGYVGTKGTRLQSTQFINTPLPGPGTIDERRPYQDFAGIAWDGQTASSNYHALQVKAERRYSNGLTFMSSFTWSKSIDDATSNSAGCLNPYNCAADRGLSSFDIPTSWVTSGVYDLPFLRHAGAWPVRTFIGGWTLSGILTFQSGLPYTLYWDGDPANTGQGSRPNAGSCSGRISNPTVNQWYDPSCFAAPAPYTYGNLGRNTMRADGIVNLDMGLYKDFAFGETRRLQVRCELFNTFNHPTFGVPYNYVNDTGSAGIISSASDPRIIQLALKLYF